MLVLASIVGCNGELQPPVQSVMMVKTQVVESRSRPRMASLIGEIRARIQSDMSFRTNGRVANRFAEVGDQVMVGKKLATLDSLQQEADVSAANAAVRSAEAVLKEATATANRLDALLKTNSISRAEYDDAQAAQSVAQGSLDISQAGLATVENLLSYTILKATVSGVIIARSVEVGQVVAAGQPLYTIAADGPREAVFDVFPAEVSDRPVTDVIQLTLVSDPAIKTTGVIREMAPAIDESNGTILVKVAIPDPPSAMTLGAPVIGVAQFRSVELVPLPWTALSRAPNHTTVWVVDRDTGIVSERPVEVGSYSSGTLFVTSGLATGDMVVTEGSQKIRPGQKVYAVIDQELSGVQP